MSIAYWVHDLSPFLIEFPDNPLGIDGIRYYGLSYLFGFLGAWILLRVYNSSRRFELNADDRATLMTAIMLGVIVGGRLGYMLLYDFANFSKDPLSLFKVNQGGMASHGGFFGVLVAVYWFARKKQCDFMHLGDVIVTLAPIGIFFGRIANFINGELWGKVTTVSWAVLFPDSPATYNQVTGTFGPEPRHPSQLYAALLEGLIPLLYIQWRFWKTRPSAGQISGEFLIIYAISRTIGECFREPDAGLIVGMSRGQFYSIFLFLAGISLIAIARIRSKKT